MTRLIEAKKVLGWDFVFLSADLSAFDDARGMGVEHASRRIALFAAAMDAIEIYYV